MTKRKTRRSRCASDTCGKQFRHADPNAATCSPACRQRVSRISRKAKQEKREHDEKYERMAAAVGKQMALAEAERQAAERERHAATRQAEEERRRSQPQPKPAPKPDDRRGWVGIGGLGPYEEPVQTITIPTKPSYIPTPIWRGRR